MDEMDMFLTNKQLTKTDIESIKKLKEYLPIDTKTLKRVDRNFIADLVINKIVKSGKVADFFRLKKRFVKYIIDARKNKFTNYDRRGNYHKIDEESDTKIKEQIYNNYQSMSSSTLLALIRKEARDSYHRRSVCQLSKPIRKNMSYISYRSCRRYLQRYENIINSIKLSDNNSNNNNYDNNSNMNNMNGSSNTNNNTNDERDQVPIGQLQWSATPNKNNSNKDLDSSNDISDYKNNNKPGIISWIYKKIFN